MSCTRAQTAESLGGRGGKEHGKRWARERDPRDGKKNDCCAREVGSPETTWRIYKDPEKKNVWRFVAAFVVVGGWW